MNIKFGMELVDGTFKLNFTSDSGKFEYTGDFHSLVSNFAYIKAATTPFVSKLIAEVNKTKEIN